MPRKKKQKIKLNQVEALEGILQEVYNEACSNINSAQKEISRLDASTEPTDVDDHTKIAKAKEGMLKIKESSIRAKMEIAKIQHSVLKEGGDVDKGVSQYSETKTTSDDMAEIRRIVMAKKASAEKDADTSDDDDK